MLDNDPANACVGCGPANARGLQLAFEATPRGARTTLVAAPWMEGWPERLHTGLLYTAMCETANWTVFAATSRVGLPVRTGALAATAWVPTGARVVIEGVSRERTAEGVTIDVLASRPDGARVASLERAFILPTRAELMARLGYDALPAVLAESFPA